MSDPSMRTSPNGLRCHSVWVPSRTFEQIQAGRRWIIPADVLVNPDGTDAPRPEGSVDMAAGDAAALCDIAGLGAEIVDVLFVLVTHISAPPFDAVQLAGVDASIVSIRSLTEDEETEVQETLFPEVST